MKFLVVDDSATMRRIVINSLQRIGFSDTVEASDGQEALAKFDSSVQFVITDWNMPNMSGTEFTKVLRSRPDGANVPVLMVTARSVKEDILTAMEAGVNNYIVKPFTPQVLKEKIAYYGHALSPLLYERLGLEVDAFRPQLGRPAKLGQVDHEGRVVGLGPSPAQ